MSERSETLDLKATGALVRERRKAKGIKSLDQLAERIEEAGCTKPSIAKLSRIETGEQPVPLDVLQALASIVEIAPEELRPDVAAALKQREAAA